MRLLVSLLCAILVTQVANAQEKKPWNVDRLCGRVEFVRRIPIRKQPDNYSEKRKAMRGVPLELYETHDANACCDGSKSVDTTTSGKNGEFEFKNEKAGHYWLTAKWNGRDYKVAVVFEPETKSSTICSQQGIQIEDGVDASWWITVTVD